MDKYLQEKADNLMKKMAKAVKKIKRPVEDVMDSNREAEVNQDMVPKGKTGVMNKDDDSHVEDTRFMKNPAKRAKRHIESAKRHKEKGKTKGFKENLKEAKKIIKENLRGKDKKGNKLPSSKDLEYPMAASEEVVNTLAKNFKIISNAYFNKKGKKEE